VTRQARAVRVRRATPGAPGSWPTLDELVAQRLAAREVDAATASWDAWRTDGTWFIRLSFPAAGRERRAEWSYDVQLRHVTPLDDEARWFVDEVSPAAAAGPLPGPGRRALAPVRDARGVPLGSGPGDGPVRERVYDVEADGGLRPVEDERAGAAAATVDLLDTLRERRGRRQWLPDPADDSDTPDALERAVDQLRVRAEALGDPPPAHPPRSRPDQLEDAEVLALPDAPAASQPAPQRVPAPAGIPQPSLDLDAAAEGERSPSRRARRASVPSWDDIVFGSRRD
jgi:hypothetical protein